MGEELRKISREKFRVIVENHKLWLADNTKGEQADLSDADLRSIFSVGKNLSKAKLVNSDLRNTHFLATNFSNANLHGSNLTNAVFIGCNFQNANLSGTSLNKTNFNNAIFTNADLTQADLTEATLARANLARANLTKVFAPLTDFSLCNLTNATLTGAKLIASKFHASSLSTTNMQGADFTFAELTGSDLRGIQMDAGTRFVGTELGHCRFGQLGRRARFRLLWQRQKTPKKLLIGVWKNSKIKVLDWIKGSLPSPGSGPTGTTSFLGANLFAADVRSFDWGLADLSGATYETANDWGDARNMVRQPRSAQLQKELEILRRYLEQLDGGMPESFIAPKGLSGVGKGEFQPELDKQFNRLKPLLTQRLAEKEKLHAEAVRRERIDGGITAVSQSIQQTDADLRGNLRACWLAQFCAYSALSAALLWGAVQHWDGVPNWLKPLHQQTAIQPEVDVNGRLNQLLQPTATDSNKPTALPPARSDGIAVLLAQERLLALLWRISPSLLGFVLGVLLLRHHRQLLVHRGNLLAQKHALEKATGILSAANYLIAPDDNYEAQMMKVFVNVQKSLLGGDKGGKTELEKDEDSLSDPLAAARKYLSGKS